MKKKVPTLLGFVLALFFVYFSVREISQLENKSDLSWELAIYFLTALFFSSVFIFGVLSISLKNRPKNFPLLAAVYFFVFMLIAAILWWFFETLVFFGGMFLGYIIFILLTYRHKHAHG